MRTPVVNYRDFRLSKINDPQFSHLKLLLGWVGYILMYFLTERLIPVQRCHVVHSRLDDIIPFCEYFIIPYVMWYLFIAGSLLYLLLYNVEGFKRLQAYIIIVQIAATLVYIFYPTMQELRPEALPHDNFCSSMVAWLYSTDTNTGVCPSLHVAISLGIASAWMKEKTASVPFKAVMIILAVTICMSTLFVKQHSVIDSFAALPVCLLAELTVYGRSYWQQKRKRC